MIIYTSGDILKANVEALVNTVNCVGIMGRGIALQFKNAFLKTSRAMHLPAKKMKLFQERCLFTRQARYIHLILS